MSGTQVIRRKSHLKSLATWGALAFGGVSICGWMATAADETQQVNREPTAATEVASIDGAELFTREWIPGDKRSHGGDGLGPVFNDSSCVACHNQGGTGGGGPSSKNVDIVTAFHAPQTHNRTVPNNTPEPYPD